MDDVVVSLDIGSSVVRVVIAEYDSAGNLQIAGWGSCPSEGIRKGVIINIEAAVKSINTAIDAAEQMAGRTVSAVYTGIAGGNIECFNSRGVVAVTDKDHEIRQSDIDRVLDAARAMVIPLDRQILHVIPQEYVIDGRSGITSPLNMIGVRLEAEVHIITGAISATENIIKCVNRGDFLVKEIIMESLAVSECVLTNDEKELGVLLIDIGGGTTDVLLHYGGSPYFTSVLSMGGDLITNDISQVLKTPMASAENIKIQFGCCYRELVEENCDVIIPGVAGRPPVSVEKDFICEIIESRVSELFQLVKHEIAEKGYLNKFSGGVVITGGSSLLPGVAELATEVFGVQTRVGFPQGLPGLSEELRHPGFSTAVGLILFAGKSMAEKGERETDVQDTRKKEGLSSLKRFFKHFF